MTYKTQINPLVRRENQLKLYQKYSAVRKLKMLKRAQEISQIRIILQTHLKIPNPIIEESAHKKNLRRALTKQSRQEGNRVNQSISLR